MGAVEGRTVGMGGERQYHWLLSRLGVREAPTGGWGWGEEAFGQAGWGPHLSSP